MAIRIGSQNGVQEPKHKLFQTLRLAVSCLRWLVHLLAFYPWLLLSSPSKEQDAWRSGLTGPPYPCCPLLLRVGTLSRVAFCSGSVPSQSRPRKPHFCAHFTGDVEETWRNTDVEVIREQYRCTEHRREPGIRAKFPSTSLQKVTFPGSAVSAVWKCHTGIDCEGVWFLGVKQKNSVSGGTGTSFTGFKWEVCCLRRGQCLSRHVA